MNGSVGSSNPPGTGGGVAQGNGVTGDSIVLEEEIDPNYVPTQVRVGRVIRLHADHRSICILLIPMLYTRAERGSLSRSSVL